MTTIPVIASRRQNKNDSELSIAYNSYNYSSERIAKGDFIRMKEISLGYNFPKELINHIGVNTLSLKLQATNLFLFYADKKLNGQDPEFFNTGGVAAPTGNVLYLRKLQEPADNYLDKVVDNGNAFIPYGAVLNIGGQPCQVIFTSLNSRQLSIYDANGSYLASSAYNFTDKGVRL